MTFIICINDLQDGTTNYNCIYKFKHLKVKDIKQLNLEFIINMI